MGDTVGDLEPAVPGESVIQGDPAVGVAFCGARSLEIFVESRLRQHIGARPAYAAHFKRREIVFIAEAIDEVNIDQRIGRCGAR